MARVPEDRYPRCQDLADDLERWLARSDQTVTGQEATAPPAANPLGRWFRRGGPAARRPSR